MWADELPDALVSALGAPGGVRLRQGVVSAVTGTQVDVDVSGATLTDVPYLASYAPAVSDIVGILSDGSGWLVLGRIRT